MVDDTLIGIEHLNSGYLTHRILEPRTLARYLEAVEDDLEETPQHLNQYLPMYINTTVTR